MTNGADAKYWYATTIDNVDGARKIEEALSGVGGVEVATINVYSHFWWDDKLHEAEETRIQVVLPSADFSDRVEKAIKENHSDDVPMVINGGLTDPEYPCVQVKVTDVTDPTIGKTVVGQQLAGCAQYDKATQTLYIKTTREKSEELVQHLRNVSDGTKIGAQEVINANKDYFDWLVTETTKKRHAEL